MKQVDVDKLKVDLPELTEKQERIINFWHIRGYEKVSHCLGKNIALHLKDKYIDLGLNLQYLEQFLDEFVDEHTVDDPAPNCENCYGMNPEILNVTGKVFCEKWGIFPTMTCDDYDPIEDSIPAPVEEVEK